MSGHADTIRQGILNADATLEEYDDGIAALDALEAEVVRQADRIAWLEGDVAGWRIKLAECEERQR